MQSLFPGEETDELMQRLYSNFSIFHQRYNNINDKSNSINNSRKKIIQLGNPNTKIVATYYPPKLDDEEDEDY